jgi:hypothetical protein
LLAITASARSASSDTIHAAVCDAVFRACVLCNAALGWGTSCCAVVCCFVQRSAALLTHDHDNLGQVLRLLQAPASKSSSVQFSSVQHMLVQGETPEAWL